MDNNNQGRKNEWERWDTDSLCLDGTEVGKTNAVCSSECKETRLGSPLKLFEELVEELSILEKPLGMPLWSVLYCHLLSTKAPYCANYCLDCHTLLIYIVWNKISTFIHQQLIWKCIIIIKGLTVLRSPWPLM